MSRPSASSAKKKRSFRLGRNRPQAELLQEWDAEDEEGALSGRNMGARASAVGHSLSAEKQQPCLSKSQASVCHVGLYTASDAPKLVVSLLGCFSTNKKNKLPRKEAIHFRIAQFA